MQKTLTILLMTIIVGIASIPILSQDEAFILISDVFAQDHEIPSWIKNNAGWWATNQIDDSTFLLGIQYLIKEGIMIIPLTETSESSGSQEIPSWIKNNAGWWADEQIDDISFVLGLQWLVTNGIIVVEEKLIQTDANLRVAFIGDQGINPDAVAVLNLIKNEGTHMVLHQGDLDYTKNPVTNQMTPDPDAWDRMISDVLGDDFPYFATIGEHDVMWNEYQQKLHDRLKKNSDVECIGDLGVKSSCTYKGLFFIQLNPELIDHTIVDTEHNSFIEEQLKNDDHMWRICSWSKNMNSMQLGDHQNHPYQGDEVGWEVYEDCKNGGAIIATAHEHSYSRTKTLIDIENQIVDAQWFEPDRLKVEDNATFVFVSGLGGKSIRDQDRCLPISYPYGCNGEWANIYTSDQSATFGALFCTFNVGGQPNKAYCYFKNIDGEIIDEFTITNFLGIHSDSANIVDVDMSGKDLSGANFSNKLMTETDLSNAILVGANLSNTVLIGTTLTGADLTDANLTGTSLFNKDLTGTILKGTNLTNANLAGVDLSNRDLTGAILKGVDLTNQDLTGTILKGVNLSNANLSGVDLSNRDLTGAILKGVDISGKKLVRTVLDHANIEDADLSNANFTLASLISIDFTKVKSITGADLSQSSLANSNLSGVNLDDVVIYRTNFAGADLRDQDFRNIANAQILASIFYESNLSNSNFEGLDFSAEGINTYRIDSITPEEFIEWLKIPGNSNGDQIIAKAFHPSNAGLTTKLISVEIIGGEVLIDAISVNNFHLSNLQNVNFKNTNLKCAYLSEADLTNANLSGADLTGTSFVDSNLANANFDGSILNETIFDKADISPSQAEILQYRLDCAN